jgi:hypothetical protein
MERWQIVLAPHSWSSEFMLSNRFKRSLRLFVLVALLVPTTGCGVAGYEAKMKEERDRLTAYDAENNVLGPPLEEPAKDAKEKAEDPPSFFFRPPKGIKTEFRRQPKDEGKRDRKYGDLLYVYPRGSEGQVAELLVAVYYDPKDELFKNLLKHPSLQGLQSQTTSKTRRIEPVGRDPFNLIEKESGDMLFFFYQKDAYRAALVFLVDKGKLSDVKEKIGLSLRSLGVGPDSARGWKEFEAQKLAKSNVQAPSGQ